MANGLQIDEISKKYSNKVYTLAFRMIGNSHDTEDIVQETFLSATKNLHKFKGNSNIYTWLYRIVINHCLQRKRRFQMNPLIIVCPAWDLPFICMRTFYWGIRYLTASYSIIRRISPGYLKMKSACIRHNS